MQARSLNNIWKSLSILLGAALFTCAVYTFFVAPEGVSAKRFSSWEESAHFGDSFGALTCLFTVLAFGGVILTISLDHRQRSEERKVSSFQALLSSIQNQIEAAEKFSGQESEEMAVLRMKQRQYSQSLEDIIKERNGLQLLDGEIIKAFSTISWFNQKEIGQKSAYIRSLLRSKGLDNNKDLNQLTNGQEPQMTLAKIYHEELFRPENEPFDFDALMLFGTYLLKNKNMPQARITVIGAVRQSPEWAKKHPGQQPNSRFSDWVHSHPSGL